VRLASRDPSVQSRIRFAGQITDEGLVDDEYASSDVLAVPSLWPEPFGIVGLEAMQHALPVVASRTGGIPEWLLDGETGYLTQPDDALDLAAKLSMLAESETLRDEFGQRALAHVRETFSWERHWERFVQIVEAARRFQAT
jgi:glycosyltransferase involved in cell wall biosynthesis